LIGLEGKAEKSRYMGDSIVESRTKANINIDNKSFEMVE
jgi:hypothetical protein